MRDRAVIVEWSRAVISHALGAVVHRVRWPSLRRHRGVCGAINPEDLSAHLSTAERSTDEEPCGQETLSLAPAIVAARCGPRARQDALRCGPPCQTQSVKLNASAFAARRPCSQRGARVRATAVQSPAGRRNLLARDRRRNLSPTFRRQPRLWAPNPEWLVLRWSAPQECFITVFGPVRERRSAGKPVHVPLAHWRHLILLMSSEIQEDIRHCVTHLGG